MKIFSSRNMSQISLAFVTPSGLSILGTRITCLGIFSRYSFKSSALLILETAKYFILGFEFIIGIKSSTEFLLLGGFVLLVGRSKNILFAFGHQHIGWTLAAVTGKAINELIKGNKPNFDINAFSPNRFK